ncbi:hypothetical protein HANVADRAFT_747, partial [Hanseniaspora valbyensis NRRL Y-1626]
TGFYIAIGVGLVSCLLSVVMIIDHKVNPVEEVREDEDDSSYSEEFCNKEVEQTEIKV